MYNYNKILLSTVFALLIPVLAVSIFLDTFWYFGTTNFFSTRKCLFDERVQKTNLLLNTNTQYDTLLLGSSRVTVMASRHFRNGDAFNYSISSATPYEYEECIAIALLRHPVRTVYIGLDFFGPTGHHPTPVHKSVPAAIEPMRKLGTLLSTDGLKYAYRTVRMSLGLSAKEYYDYEYVRHWPPYNSHKKEAMRNQFLTAWKNLGPNYQWNPPLSEISKDLHNKFKQIKFVVFTTPVSSFMFDEMMRDRLPAYENWIRLIVQEFGAVYDFMGHNSLTNDLNNYVDEQHYLPPVGEAIVHRLEGRTGFAPDDFGVLVTPDNLEEHLNVMRQQAKEAAQRPRAEVKTVAK